MKLITKVVVAIAVIASASAASPVRVEASVSGCTWYATGQRSIKATCTGYSGSGTNAWRGRVGCSGPGGNSYFYGPWKWGYGQLGQFSNVGCPNGFSIFWNGYQTGTYYT